MSLAYVPFGTTGVGGDSGSLPSLNLENTGPPTVFSGIRFDVAGTISVRNANGSWGVRGNWLSNGAAVDFSINHGTVDGTLTTDAGAGPLQMSAGPHIYDVQASVPATDANASAQFTLENWNGGTPNVTYDTETYVFDANAE